MEMGYHLNFRDPDDVALELFAPNELMLTARQLMATGQLTKADIAAFVSENISPDVIPRVGVENGAVSPGVR
jgi:glyoxylase I family protein